MPLILITLLLAIVGAAAAVPHHHASMICIVGTVPPQVHCLDHFLQHSVIA
jgi:hypothetical protein